MAVMDRMRERLRGQRPVGAAEAMAQPKMPMGAQIPDIRRGGATGGGPAISGMGGAPVQPGGGMTPGDLDMLTSRRTAEEQEAAQMGARMGAGSVMSIAGRMPLGGAGEDNGRIMSPQRLNEATQTLQKYQGAKSSINRRVIAAQQWWKLKNWEQIRNNRGTKGATTTPSNTGWLWNCIVGKHADTMDSYPEPIILPRAKDDKEEATRLSKIVPAVLEINGFEQTYSDEAWQKLQEGTGVYGVFWNSRKLNGLGDIDIKKVNILNLYWEPGINNIEDSRNVFYVSYEDKNDLIAAYPELEGKLNSSKIRLVEYKTDDHVDLKDKAAVIDWYYKKNDGGRTVLHYCKYVDETCLYSSEEAGLTAGYYEDGEYPFVMDVLFPVEGSPAGYGYIDIAKDTQTDIDTLSQAMVLNAALRATPRYFMRKDGSINEKEFADWSKPIVHVSGNLGDDSQKPIEVQQMGNDAHNMLQQKIDEIKFITGNTDVNNGGVPSGVTAASAIAALKEDSGRSSKDSNKAAYRAHRILVNKVIERIRQFYNLPRQFRIIGDEGKEEFIQYSNENIQMQQIINLPGVEPGLRLPVFDIEIRAQRENAYTKMSQNELALQFFNNGVFNPQLTDQVIMMLDMMDFRGKEELRQKIQQQGTMQQVMMQMAQIALGLAQRFDPMAAQQIMMLLQQAQGGGGALPAGGMNAGNMANLSAPADNMSAPNPNENGIVRNARMRAENATRPS